MMKECTPTQSNSGENRERLQRLMERHFYSIWNDMIDTDRAGCYACWHRVVAFLGMAAGE